MSKTMSDEDDFVKVHMEDVISLDDIGLKIINILKSKNYCEQLL